MVAGIMVMEWQYIQDLLRCDGQLMSRTLPEQVKADKYQLTQQPSLHVAATRFET